jgi:hypothetical protein
MSKISSGLSGFVMITSDKFLTVILDRACIGFLLGGARGFKAYDSEGQPPGMFGDEMAAAEEVYRADASIKGEDKRDEQRGSLKEPRRSVRRPRLI